MCMFLRSLLTPLLDTPFSTRPFPIDPNEPEEEYQLTFRAIFVGCALGAVGALSRLQFNEYHLTLS